MSGPFGWSDDGSRCCALATCHMEWARGAFRRHVSSGRLVIFSACLLLLLFFFLNDCAPTSSGAECWASERGSPSLPVTRRRRRTAGRAPWAVCLRFRLLDFQNLSPLPPTRDSGKVLAAKRFFFFSIGHAILRASGAQFRHVSRCARVLGGLQQQQRASG